MVVADPPRVVAVVEQMVRMEAAVVACHRKAAAVVEHRQMEREAENQR